jgi:ribosomal protein S18 acetylase RimI-like enzyme
VARSHSEIRIIDIALLPDYRGCGFGSRVLREILEEADTARRKVSIHVEMFNPARRLYERLGFEPAGEYGIYLLLERSSPVSGAAKGPCHA